MFEYYNFKNKFELRIEISNKMSKDQNNDDSMLIDPSEETFVQSILHYILDQEQMFRRFLEYQLNDTLPGKIVQHCSAMMAGASSVVYVVLTYNKDCPLILEQWYNQIEFFICWFMLVMYLL